MPELPEVETVVRTLQGMIKDLKVIDIEYIYDRIIEDDLNDFKQKLIGQHFRNFKRRGKYLIFEMDDVALIAHLRMEGKFYYLSEDEDNLKHSHIIFHLNNHHKLVYNDTRKFGRMHLYPLSKHYDFHNLGYEPFDERLNLEYVKSKLNNKNLAIKTCLLDQSFIAGIGNIYADEICFRMKIHPSTKASCLKNKDYLALIKETQKVLLKAIEEGGTTIRSYTSSLGVTGRFQNDLLVHTQKRCKICNSEIKKIKVNQRGTYYCPKCQKER